jgi:radical SAM superfamily enzyme YgiQ (UPF0313 family)
MARVALVKLLSGLNMAVRQLSGELQRAGHDSRILFFKTYVVGPSSLQDRYESAEHPALTVFERGEEWNWNMFRSVTDRERELLVQELLRFGADLVGLSMPTMCLGMAEDLTDFIHRKTNLPVVWGGQGPTLEPERAIGHADVVCINEGEQVIVELANRIDAGAPLTEVPGTWARSRDGEIVQNPRRPLLELESIAIPDSERRRMVLVDGDEVKADYCPYDVLRTYDIMTQRGCPFSCSFCVESKYQEMFGKKGSLRRRSVDVVLEELRSVKDALGIDSVSFWDDVFTINRPWLREFAARYPKEVGLPFWCYTYPTTTRAEDVKMLRDAGCVSMTMGIQSGSQRILNDYFNRPTPLARAIEAAEIVMDAGILLYFDLISKVDWETEQDLKDTFEFLLKLPDGIRISGVGYMRTYPGYSYTNRLATERPERFVDDETYAFYHRLYYLALADLPLSTKRAIAGEPIYRKYPALMASFLPQKLDLNYLKNEGTRRIRKRMKNQQIANLGIGQGRLARDAEASVRSTRRLPLIA